MATHNPALYIKYKQEVEGIIKDFSLGPYYTATIKDVIVDQNIVMYEVLTAGASYMMVTVPLRSHYLKATNPISGVPVP